MRYGREARRQAPVFRKATAGKQGNYKNMNRKIISNSKEQTQKFAAEMAKEILARAIGNEAVVLALSGDLGAGKTTFTQGFIKSLGVKNHITSPTFVIFRKYEFNSVSSDAPLWRGSESRPERRERQGKRNVYHFDLYRIEKTEEILDLGFKEIISNPENIVLVEWPEKIKNVLPKNTIWIEFGHGKNLDQRLIKISDVL